MKAQYYYEPPRRNVGWLENLRPLIEPPLAYLVFFIGIGLALWLYQAEAGTAGTEPISLFC